MSKNFCYAVATLIGTIIGVGIFGIPYVVSKSGFTLGIIFLLFLSGMILIMHLLYGEVILRTTGKHRFVGYAKKYLGKWGKYITTLTSVSIFYGALLAYVIVSGEFLKTIFGGSDFIWSLLFFIVCALAIFFGLKVVSKIEIFMSLFLIAVIFIIFFKGWPEIELSNFVGTNLKYFFLPYGVILWALSGWAAIPEMKEIFSENKKAGYKLFKKAIIWGTLIPVFLCFIFLFTVIGVTGQETSAEAIQGLVKILENGTIILGAIFGILAVTTSFLIVGLTLKKIFWYDYGINKNLSWILVVSVPLMFFLFDVRNFVAVIGFMGAVFSALEGIILILIYQKAKKQGKRQPEYTLKLKPIVLNGLILILSLGLFYQIFSYF